GEGRAARGAAARREQAVAARLARDRRERARRGAAAAHARADAAVGEPDEDVALLVGRDVHEVEQVAPGRAARAAEADPAALDRVRARRVDGLPRRAAVEGDR